MYKIIFVKRTQNKKITSHVIDTLKNQQAIRKAKAMEAVGDGIENSTEVFTRNTRRARNNNNNHDSNRSINSKLNESKDQENVNNISLVQSEAETSIKDEVIKSDTTIENKVNANTTSLNSSTPRSK